MTVDEISKLTITAISEGFDKATADVNRLTSSTEGLQIMAEKSATSTGKIQNALDKQQRSLDGVYNAQQTYNRSQLVLTQALNSGVLSQSRFNELTDLNAQRMTRASEAASLLQRDTGKLGEVAAVVESRMAGMSASLGVVGEVLSVIGPFGLASAVGIGALVVAGLKLTESANAAGDWARQLKDASETINLTTVQLQAFDLVAGRAGVNIDANNQAFEKFTVNLGALKEGTGSLYTELSKVNPTLVSQLSVTNDNVAAWDLLAKSYAAADQQQQKLIARAAFGRGGLSEGRVLLGTDSLGGIDGAVASMNQLDLVTKAQSDHWAELRKQIEDASASASRNISSIFTSTVLEAEASFFDHWLELSRSLKEFQPGSGWNSFMQDLLSATGQVPVLLPLFAAVSAFGSSVTNQRPAAGAPPPQPTFNQRSAGLSFSAVPSSAGVELSNYKQLIAVLGAAATPAELLHEKILQLAKDLSDYPKYADAAARSQAELDARFAASQTSQLVGLFGNLASVSLLVRQRQDQIAEAQSHGAPISDMLAKSLSDLYEAQLRVGKEQEFVSALGAAASVEDRIAVATEALNLKRKAGMQLSDAQVAVITANTRAQEDGTAAIIQQANASRIEAATVDMSTAAATAYRIEQDKIDAARQVNQRVSAQTAAAWHQEALAAGEAAGALERVKVASSITFDRTTVFFSSEDLAIVQRLKPLFGDDLPAALASTYASQIRLNDALKQTNDLAGTFASGFVTDLSHGVTAVDALHNAMTRLADTLLDMASRQLVSAALGGLAGTFFGGSLGVSSGGSAGILPALHHTGGIVGAEPGGYRYVSPAYFDDAPRFHSGGIAGDEVPIIARKGEGVFTPGQMAAMGGSTNVINAPITVQVQGGGTSADHQDQAQAIGDAVETRLRALMRDEMANQSRQGGILRR